MSHAEKADELLIKPAAGARPASPHRSDGSFARHATRPVTRRVTNGTTTTRLATAPDRPTQPSLTVTPATGTAGTRCLVAVLDARGVGVTRLVEEELLEA
jgi:hypothetical protein